MTGRIGGDCSCTSCENSLWMISAIKMFNNNYWGWSRKLPVEENIILAVIANALRP